MGDEEPAARGTLGFNLTWKRFSVYTTFMYEFGGQRYNRTLADKVESVDILNENVDSRVLTKRWKQPGDVSAFKKYRPAFMLGMRRSSLHPDLFRITIG